MTGAINDILRLDTSQESCDEDGEISSIEHINLEKTLPPGVAPEGFIVLDESIDISEETTSDVQKNSPLFKIEFRDETVSLRYKAKVKEFFQSIVSADFKDDKSNSLILDVWCNGNEKDGDDVEIQNHTLFKIDSTPGGQDRYNVPTYGKKFERVVKRALDMEEEDKIDKAGPKMTCFNCLGNHSLRDCSSPRNANEINKNRKEFNSRSTPKNIRYHVDDLKYKPGVLSGDLRKALGLRSDELPKHIFRMRVLGYPPGWLEEAKLEHSGLNLYDADTAAELNEICDPEKQIEYDIKKVYDFPGFNIPAPDGIRDGYWHEQEKVKHSKETMLQALNTSTAEEGYKRKTLKRRPTNIIDASANMEVDTLEDTPIESVSSSDAFMPPLPKSPVSECLPLPPSCSDEDIESYSPLQKNITELCGDSPSLAELENKKTFLLTALDDSNLESIPGTPVQTRASQSSTPQCQTSMNSSSTTNDITPKIGSVKSIEFGTPILESTSCYSKLPSSEKFSKNICDVMYFENLPGATGKFEKMHNLLMKVRETLTYEQDQE